MVSIAFSYFIANVCQEIESIAKELEKVNGSRRITPEFKFVHSSHRKLLWFHQFYQKLRFILSRNPSSIYRPGEPSEIAPPPQTTSQSSPTIPTTPPPSSTVINPQYSSSSNATASSKAESKDEPFTHSLANQFVYGSYESLSESLNSIAWYRDTKYELLHACVTAEECSD